MSSRIRAPLEIGVTCKIRDKGSYEEFSLARRNACCTLDLLREVCDQLVAVEFDIRQHLAHCVAVRKPGHFVGTSRPTVIESEVHRVRVSKEIVKVPEDLLIGPGQEDAQCVRLSSVHAGGDEGRFRPIRPRRIGRSSRPNRT